MRVLITDGDTRQALAATRSLGRAGHEVFTLAHRHASLSGASRYCAGSECSPEAAVDSEGFVASVIDSVVRRGVQVVLPMTEISTLLLTRDRDRLPQHCRLPFPSYESVLRAGNKVEVLELARRTGVPIPESLTLSTASSPIAQEALRYPVVVKPACSRVRTSNGWIANSVGYANDAESLKARLSQLPAESYPVLIQERIQGQGVGVFMLFDHGRRTAQFAHRRVREKPPSGGVSVLCESTPVDPIAARHAESLLQQLEWHGPAMVEFKRDDRDGSLRLMEINGRFWGSLQLAIDAGVDFPKMLVEIVEGSSPDRAPDYRVGVRCRWLAGDLDSLLLSTMKSRRAQNLPPSYPGRLRAIWDFLKFGTHETRCEIERSDDVGPALLEWRRRLLGSPGASLPATIKP